jgi:hypothetical protein
MLQQWLRSCDRRAVSTAAEPRSCLLCSLSTQRFLFGPSCYLLASRVRSMSFLGIGSALEQPSPWHNNNSWPDYYPNVSLDRYDSESAFSLNDSDSALTNLNYSVYPPPSPASSYGSVDTGVSHPPRSGKKGKKVVSLSYSELLERSEQRSIDHNFTPYTPRDHHLYQYVTPQSDGLYHCPWEKDPIVNCQHKPEKLKCQYE